MLRQHWMYSADSAPPRPRRAGRWAGLWAELSTGLSTSRSTKWVAATSVAAYALVGLGLWRSLFGLGGG